MADRPINLNRFRKRKEREAREREAERNRVREGASGAQRAQAGRERQRRETQLEGLRREPAPELRSERLQLRAWRAEDLAPFARLNADPQVARHLSHALSRAESDALARRIGEHFARHGFGLWAVEVPGVAPFIGFVGLAVPSFEAAFTPCVEVGWRLAHEFWGRGYATEGARCALDFAFRRLELDEVVSFTVPANRGSRRVMHKLGLAHDPADDFDHPALPEHHALRRHVLYRISRATWLERT